MRMIPQIQLYYLLISVSVLLGTATASNQKSSLSLNTTLNGLSESIPGSSHDHEGKELDSAAYTFRSWLDSVIEIVNNGHLTFTNGINISSKEFEDECLSREVVLDPFCKSIKEAFLIRNMAVLPFHNFLFNGFRHCIENFNAKAPDSWELLINLAFTQFFNIPENRSCACEIIEKIVVPNYQIPLLSLLTIKDLKIKKKGLMTSVFPHI